MHTTTITTTTGTTITSTSTRVHPPKLALPRREFLLLLPPAVLGLLWLGLLFASFGAVVRVIYSNGDVVSAPVIGELYPHEATGATTTLGFLSWYSTLWFELATRWLSFHRQLWEVGPWLASLAGVAIVAWATAKVAGRWAGWFVAFVLVCSGDRLLPIQFGSGPYHGITALNVCVLDAFLVLLVLRRGKIGNRPTHVLVCALVAAATAGGLASDELLIPAGLVPFLLAGITQLWWTPRATGVRIALSTALVGACSLVGDKVATDAMHSVHTYAAQNTITFAAWDDLVRNVFRLFQSLADLFNGDFGGASIDSRSVLALACAVALGWAAVVGIREARSHFDRLRASQPATTPAREVHVAFWASVVMVTSAAFVFSSFAEISGGRYLVAVGYGIVVLAAVAVSSAGRFTRGLGALAACVIVGGSVVALAAGDIKANPGHYPQPDFARFLTTFAQGENLKYGYASYWDAAALTWESKKLEVYPALQCSAPGGLCTYPLHVISSWYTPKAGERTFLVTDPRYGPSDPGQSLGAPVEVVSYAGYRIYVYGYDIASNFGDWRAYGADAG